MSHQQMKYKKPRFQSVFLHKKKLRDLFDDPEYVKRDNQTDVFAFGSDGFSIQNIYQYYY